MKERRELVEELKKKHKWMFETIEQSLNNEELEETDSKMFNISEKNESEDNRTKTLICSQHNENNKINEITNDIETITTLTYSEIPIQPKASQQNAQQTSKDVLLSDDELRIAKELNEIKNIPSIYTLQEFFDATSLSDFFAYRNAISDITAITLKQSLFVLFYFIF